jgi:hypothetical protein
MHIDSHPDDACGSPFIAFTTEGFHGDKTRIRLAKPVRTVNMLRVSFVMQNVCRTNSEVSRVTDFDFSLFSSYKGMNTMAYRAAF